MLELSHRKSQNLVDLFSIVGALAIYTVLIYHIFIIYALGLPNILDEAVTLIALGFITFRALRDPVAARLLFIFVLGMVVLTLLSFESLRYRGIVNVVIQNLIHLKILIYFGFMWLTLNNKRARWLIIFLLAMTIFFMMVNFATGDLFNKLTGIAVNLRGGMVRPIGIQADTAGLGMTFAMIGLYFLMRDFDNYSSSQILVLSLFVILILFSTSRTALVLLPLVAVWWMRESYKLFVLVLLFGVIGFFVLRGNSYILELIEITALNIEWTIESPEEAAYIRGIMIYYAFVLATDRFPFGTGAASYGTLMSDNSPIYTEIGLQNSRFFIEKSGIYDSNFASILGEFGYLGLALYGALLVWTFAVPALVYKNKFKWSKGFKYTFWGAVFAYSVTIPVFMNSYPAMLLAAVGVAAYYNDYWKRHQTKEDVST